MADAEQYGPILPPATQTDVHVTIGPTLPPGYSKQESLNQEGSGTGDSSVEGGSSMDIGPMVSEMSHGDEVVQAAEEFERRSRKMKDHLTVKAEAEPGPSKREEWMTELPPEMSKNIGVTARTFSKGVGQDDKDRSEWTDTPAEKLKKEKESKGKKRKREEEKNPAKQRDLQLQHQVDEYNKKNRAESLVEMHQKSKKKKKNPNVADSTQQQTHTQVVQTQTQTLTQLTPLQHQQLQQHQVVTASGEQLQYMQLTEDSLRDSLDLLGTDQKSGEYYGGDYQGATEYSEAKPLADLLLNQNMVSYNQDGSATVLGTSQMIAQAYNQAQLSTSGLSQHQLLASGLAQQVGGQMGITIIPAPAQDGQDGQVMTEDAHGTVHTINGATYSGSIVGSSQAGTSISAFLPHGQNVIIASPGNQQAGNFIFTSTGQMATGLGQNIVIAAPGQQGGYLVKQETQEELAQTLVLASQNPQHPGVLMSNTGTHTATLSDGTSVVFTHPPPSATPNSDGHGGKAITLTSKALTGTISACGSIQAHSGMQPVSLVLPHGSFLPQLQSVHSMAASANSTSPAILQMGAKLDKLLLMMQEAIRAINETNKRLDRLEGQVSMTPPLSKSKKKTTSAHTVTASTITSTASQSTSAATTSPGQSKSELKAALADYLTITDFNNKDELKRNESSSDLFIPVGTVSLPIQDSPSPTGETASSTVSELPDQHLLVMNNAAPLPVMESPEVAVGTDGVSVDIPDSQSGISVTLYDTEGATYELGPDSSKDTSGAGARFTTVSQNPKTVIVDPKFWEMLVEDFQKNMTSKQIMSALASIRKPLVRNMGNNEISICSSVLKEAEEACQGRRERLAKELVFRIFTLGEVYDRNVSGVFYIKGKKMENKHKALDPAKMSAIRFLVMRYPPSVLDNPRLEKLVWKNCVDRINDALRRIYNWIHKLVDINSIVDKLPTHSVLQSP